MNIKNNVSLANYSTMRLGGSAKHLVEISSPEELTEAVNWADNNKLSVIVIGQGSNIVWTDKGYSGLVIVNKIMGFKINPQGDGSAVVLVGAGENWDSVVARTVENRWHGIEALSLIPGTAGATPVQNVGAYGSEISNCLIKVEAYDNQKKKFISISGEDCQFAYRTSRFKSVDRGRYFITSLSLSLTKASPSPPFYPSLQTYLDEHKITAYTPQTIRDAVIAIRRSKLPDPAKVANNGSFFANPVIKSSGFAKLRASYPEAVHWQTSDDQVKVSAAWLVEKAGFKDYHDQETGMATWPTQSLTLINEHAQSTSQLLSFRNKIIKAVQDKFSITLEQEPELLGN